MLRHLRKVGEHVPRAIFGYAGSAGGRRALIRPRSVIAFVADFGVRLSRGFGLGVIIDFSAHHFQRLPRFDEFGVRSQNLRRQNAVESVVIVQGRVIGEPAGKVRPKARAVCRVRVIRFRVASPYLGRCFFPQPFRQRCALCHLLSPAGCPIVCPSSA